MADGEYEQVARMVMKNGIHYLDGTTYSDKALKKIAGWSDHLGKAAEAVGSPQSIVDKWHENADDIRDLIDDDNAAAAAANEAADEDAENAVAQASGGNLKGANKAALRIGGRRGHAALRQQGRKLRPRRAVAAARPAGGGLQIIGRRERDPEAPEAQRVRRGAALLPGGGGIRDLLRNLQEQQEAAAEPAPTDDLDLSTLLQLLAASKEEEVLNTIPMTNDLKFTLLALLLGGGALGGDGGAPAADEGVTGLALSGLGGSSSSGTPLDPLSSRVQGRQNVVLSGGTLAAAATTFSISVTMNSSIGGPYFVSFIDPSGVGYMLSSMAINGTPVYTGPGNGVAFIPMHRATANDSRGLPVYVGQGYRDYTEYISKCGCQGAWDVPITVGSVLTFTGTLTAALAAVTPFGIQIACTPVGSAQGMAVGNGAQVNPRDMQLARALLGRGGGGGGNDLSSLMSLLGGGNDLRTISNAVRGRRGGNSLVTAMGIPGLGGGGLNQLQQVLQLLG